jgi:hypothetical protein
MRTGTYDCMSGPARMTNMFNIKWTVWDRSGGRGVCARLLEYFVKVEP